MHYLELIKEIIDYIAVIIMIWGVILTTIKTVMIEMKFKDTMKQVYQKEKIRVFLGSYILLGLEMLIVADLIAIIIHPTYQELTVLVIIVIVRTIISFFLGKEMKEAANDIERLEREGE